MKYKISIVVPCYNSINFIEECIESILSQTFIDFEILCVDANSSDGTLEFLKRKALEDDRIKIILSDKKSLGYQINLGITHANGKYLCIVESDDYIAKNMCKELFLAIEQYKVDIVKADIIAFYDGKTRRKFIYKNISYDKNLYDRVLDKTYSKYILKNTWNMNQSSIYNLDFIKTRQIYANETLGASYQDLGLWFWLCVNSSRTLFLNKAYYYYRQDNLNSSSNSKEKIYCVCDECDFIEQKILDDNLKDIFYYIKYRIYMWNLYRIKKDFRILFLEKIMQDFKNIKKDYLAFFSESEKKNLELILKDYKKYYKKNHSLVGKIKKITMRYKRKILCKLKP
ncbi:glycosyltransferase [Campylobacter lari]|uniref:glycosyltransferase n=1 Tax=Campylobacter lari TaxID=201 RepID=UPI00214A2D0C|nr:glycosyltransferase family 2 protein [Campylobacter lari]MCR2075079.1 glycosyltransferase family 2 protein [Campylobacter lari subsp. concheus]MCR2082785.1 glycosyltransferase family 2 protein [Campylobacter lari subsp. concheus]MCR2084368.1 glycosyltransferase family 2 protein [Campylobacter lari subsp. concheus]